MKPQAAQPLNLRKKGGAASALIILLLVLLIFFGILALVTAAADLRLAVRRADLNQAYYTADSQAEQVLALIGQTCGDVSFQTVNNMARIAALNGLLEADPAVIEQQVQLTGGLIRVDARIVAHNETGQGIDMTLLIDADTTGEAPEISITRWTWWRLPFDYDQHPGGVWEG